MLYHGLKMTLTAPSDRVTDHQQIEADYVSAVAPTMGAEVARTQFHHGFDMLLDRNIIANSE